MRPRTLTVVPAPAGSVVDRVTRSPGSRGSRYLGRGDAFDEAVQAFVDTYADQNERDHQVLVQAIASGRVPAEAGR